MYSGRLVFSQVMDFMPINDFTDVLIDIMAITKFKISLV